MINMEDLEAAIKSNKELLEKTRAENYNLKSEIENHRIEIKRLHEQQQEANNNINIKHSIYNDNEKLAFSLISKIHDDNIKLEEEKHRIAVEAILKDEPSFMDAVKARLLYQIDSLQNGLTNLGSYIEPQDFANKLNNIANNPRDFSEQGRVIRAARQTYQNKQKEICSKSLRGQQVSLDDKRERVYIIDNLLNSDYISPLWNK